MTERSLQDWHPSPYLGKVVAPQLDNAGHLRGHVGARKECCFGDAARVNEEVEALFNLAQQEEAHESNILTAQTVGCRCQLLHTHSVASAGVPASTK